MDVALDSVRSRLWSLLRRDVIRRATFYLKVLILLICVIFMVIILRNFVEFRREGRVAHDLVEQAAKKAVELASLDLPAGQRKVAWETLRSAAPLGQLGEIAAPVVAQPTALPQAKVPLVLVGTFTGGGAQPYAIIEDSGKRSQEVFMLNEQIFGVATLKKIYSDKVEIDRSGSREVLTLDDAPSGGSSGEAEGGSSAVEVDGRELEDALANLPLLLTQARAVPYFKDGKSVGLRLFAIKTGSLFEKIGLQNGDILKSVNGNSLADMTQAIKLFEKLKEERSLSLVLERRRQEMTVNYSIR